MACEVAGFILDWDERERGPVTRAMLVKHVIHPENQHAFKEILTAAKVQLNRIGAGFHVGSVQHNNLVFEYNLPEIDVRSENEEDCPMNDLRDSIRDLILGLILLEDEQKIKEGEHLSTERNEPCYDDY
jgi:hypothetical protein